MRFIELFAGIGGFRYGLERANNSSQSTETKCNKTEHIEEQECRGFRTLNEKRRDSLLSRPKQLTGDRIFQCVYANEWDKYTCQIYRKNFGDKELIEGDIREIPAESVPDHDLLTAGFPCQSFSIAGKRKGFGDTRGTLFFEICRIVEKKRPHLLLLENVKGLLNHDGGNTFRIILDSLSELGYDCEWEVLNSKNFGVPQNRERVFIIGYLRGTGGQKVFPIGETQEMVDKKTDTRRQDNICKRANEYNQTISRQFLGTESVSDWRIRRLTPIECERLQGFPDGWTEGISDTQRYKCLGNAVTVNVITEIGLKILRRSIK